MYDRRPTTGKCPRCAGPMVIESFGSDCRGNPGGSGKSCAGLCYMFFDYGMEGYRPDTDPLLWDPCPEEKPGSTTGGDERGEAQ